MPIVVFVVAFAGQALAARILATPPIARIGKEAFCGAQNFNPSKTAEVLVEFVDSAGVVISVTPIPIPPGHMRGVVLLTGIGTNTQACRFTIEGVGKRDIRAAANVGAAALSTAEFVVPAN